MPTRGQQALWGQLTQAYCMWITHTMSNSQRHQILWPLKDSIKILNVDIMRWMILFVWILLHWL